MNLKEIRNFFLSLFSAGCKKKLQLKYNKRHVDLEMILQTLQASNLISGYRNFSDHVIIYLLYDWESMPLIKQIHFISKSSRKQNVSSGKTKIFLNHYPYSLSLIRTQKGLITFQKAFQLKAGGELLVILE